MAPERLSEMLASDEEATHRAIGRLLGDAREKAGMPQTHVARALGLTQSRVARLELGRRRLLFWEAVAFAALYGVPLSAFDPSRHPATERDGRRARTDARRSRTDSRGLVPGPGGLQG